MTPNKKAMLEHVTALFGGLSDYSDGRMEIRWTSATGRGLNKNEYFEQREIEQLVDRAYEINSVEGQNVYILASLVSPDAPPFGFPTDNDAYVTPFAWADIDDNVPDLKSRYEKAPPFMVVVTGRHPHTRTQLWFKYDEPQTDGDTIREVNSGLAASFLADRSVVNPARVMRLGGSIAWPKKEGRITELTELHFLPSSKVLIPEQLLQLYPAKESVPLSSGHVVSTAASSSVNDPLGLQERVTDGRERYMSDMVYASIINLNQKNGRIPEAQEVYDDVWPVYSSKVTPRNGRTLDQDGRGEKALIHKIRSKLRAFSQGRMPHKLTVGRQQQDAPQPQTVKHNTETGEISELANEAIVNQNIRVLPLVYADDVHPVLETSDFVEDVLCENQFSVIYGESNCGKTFFMLDLAIHVALGRKWRDKAVEQGGVIYAALEGGNGTRNRLAAFKRHSGVIGSIPLAVIPSGINFMDKDGDIQSLLVAIREAKERIGNVKLVVIDTLARAISGGDENSSSDMGQLVINADLLRAETGAHIAFVHHSGKDAVKGARGHSSLRAAVDTEIEISRPDTESPSLIKIVKQREIEMIEDMAFTLKTVELGENARGKQVTSCVVVPCGVEENEKEVKLSHVQQFAYDAICNAIVDVGVDVHLHKFGNVRAITYDQFNDSMALMGWSKSDDAYKIKKATNNTRSALRDKGKICFDDGYIWLPKQR